MYECIHACIHPTIHSSIHLPTYLPTMDLHSQNFCRYREEQNNDTLTEGLFSCHPISKQCACTTLEKWLLTRMSSYTSGAQQSKIIFWTLHVWLLKLSGEAHWRNLQLSFCIKATLKQRAHGRCDGVLTWLLTSAPYLSPKCTQSATEWINWTFWW